MADQVGHAGDIALLEIIMEKKIFRVGKTQRDHKSGAWMRCIQNKVTRAAFQNDTNKSKSFQEVAHTCNGKKNRFAHSQVI